MRYLTKSAELATARRRLFAWFSASLPLLTAAFVGSLGISVAPHRLAAQIIAGPAIVEARKIVEGGDIVEVEGCSIHSKNGELTIATPGELFDLWPVKGKVNAPLVLQEAAGDFVVEVEIARVDKADEGTAIPGAGSTTAFHAGTLAIWQDERNFVRLDRTDMNKAGRAITSSYLHIFQDGERVVELSTVIEDRPTRLRLSRRGASLTAASSQDGGRTWKAYPAQKIDLPDKLRVGIAALNNTSRPCVVVFADFKITETSEP